MRLALLSPAALALLLASSAPAHRAGAPPTLVPNANEKTAGTLNGDALTLNLDAVTASWPDKGSAARGATVAALAERGKAPSLPAPLIRVGAGTLVKVSVHNTLPVQLTFFLPTSPVRDDSVVVAPGATAELAVRAQGVGSFIYRATTTSKVSAAVRVEGAMAGAMIVDAPGTPRLAGERVMVILETPDSLVAAEVQAGKSPFDASGWFTFTINGKAWPNTDRIAGTVGDSLHWRVLNASFDVHPMHLHGFYYRVDEFTGPGANADDRGAPGRMVVTERMTPFTAMRMTWGPERAGNWIFHCHFSLHLAPDAATYFPVPPASRELATAHENHAMTGMVGLALELNIAPRRGVAAVADTSPARKLRLIAVADSGYPAMRPSLRFIIEENGRRTAARPGFSPTLYLKRNERVAITVVNQMSEATGVHWHGMELESYFDGVAGLSGAGTRLAPTIAPRDSFTARFTPPRSGTFMYHSHMDDVRQQPAGLVGAMIVSDGPAMDARGNPDDFEIFLKGYRDGDIGNPPLEFGGRSATDTLVLRAGRPARLRFMSLDTTHPNATVFFTARPDSAFTSRTDSMVVRWTPVAKDGADLPMAARVSRSARQTVAMGETFDFEYTPPRRGDRFHIEVRSGAGVLFTRLPVRVE